MKWHLLFPVAASLLYVTAALFMKRAQQLGAGVLRATFIANVVTAVVFAALLPMGGTGQPLNQIWQPALAALFFIVGQVFSVLALSLGDVSVATPMLGAKTIFVAWFSTLLLATRLPWQLWCAAGVSVAAIALLNLAPGSGKSAGHRRVGRTLLFSMIAASAYALFDVLVQKWSPAWGAGRFLPIMLGLSALMSLGFIPFFRAPLSKLPRAAWPSMATGALFMALQSISLVSAVAFFGDATAINVVYSARGVWSVVAVWLIGHWFANTESQLGGGVFRWRLAGALLMTSAIVLVVSR